MKKIEELPIDNIYLITNEKFKQHFHNWRAAQISSKSIHIISDGSTSNENRRGAIGSLNFLIQNHNIDDDVLIIAGDNLFEFSLHDCLNLFSVNNASMIAVYDLKEKEKLAHKMGTVLLDETNRIIDFEEKPAEPKSTLAATCCYVLKKDSLNRLSEFIKESTADSPGNFINWLRKKETVYGFVFDEHWFDIGSFNALDEARERYS
jgi:glucose-1-phosphate thymidylyltransferase